MHFILSQYVYVKKISYIFLTLSQKHNKGKTKRENTKQTHFALFISLSVGERNHTKSLEEFFNYACIFSWTWKLEKLHIIFSVLSKYKCKSTSFESLQEKKIQNYVTSSKTSLIQRLLLAGNSFLWPPKKMWYMKIKLRNFKDYPQYIQNVILSSFPEIQAIFLGGSQPTDPSLHGHIYTLPKQPYTLSCSCKKNCEQSIS